MGSGINHHSTTTPHTTGRRRCAFLGNYDTEDELGAFAGQRCLWADSEAVDSVGDTGVDHLPGCRVWELRSSQYGGKASHPANTCSGLDPDRARDCPHEREPWL